MSLIASNPFKRQILALLSKESTYPRTDGQSFHYLVVWPSKRRFQGHINHVGITHAAVKALARHRGITYQPFTLRRTASKSITNKLHINHFKSQTLTSAVEGYVGKNSPRQLLFAQPANIQTWSLDDGMRLFIWDGLVEARKNLWANIYYKKVEKGKNRPSLILKSAIKNLCR